MIKLEDVCDISSGGTPSRGKPEYYKGDIPWAKISDIENAKEGILTETEEHITEDGLKSIGNRIFPKGTLLFAMYGSIGKVAITGREIATNQAILGIRPKNDKQVYLPYLKVWFERNKQNLINQGRGVALQNLSATIIRNLKIPFPSREDQIRIANILSKAEALISQRKESLRLLDELLKSTFLEMFGDPGINRKGWPVTKLEENIDYMGDIGSNGSNEMVAKNLVMLDKEDYAIMVRTVNLNSNDFTNKVKYISKETYECFKKSKIYGGEIIMNKIGSPGDFWLMPKLNRPVSLGLNQLVIRPKNINTLYLFYYLSTDYGTMIIKSKINGATTKSITKGAVKNLPLMHPPLQLQNEFAHIVEKTEALKAHYQTSLQELENLYGSLSQRAFKGELGFKEGELAMAAEPVSNYSKRKL